MTDAADGRDRGVLIVLSGPSGVGKTTIVRTAREQFDGVFSISATTRAKSDQERDGVDYLFLTPDAFQAMIDDGAFLEYAQVFGKDSYGTPRAPVEEALHQGRVLFLDIDVQGAQQVRAAMPDAYMIFIEPPSIDELRRRLEARGRDDAEAIERRLAEARLEMERAHASGVYDAFVVNDDLPRAEIATSALIRTRLESSPAAR